MHKGMEMNRELRSFLNVYLGLVLLTVCSLLLADSGLFAASISRHMNEIFILVIAGVKIFLVSNYFMELRFSPKWLRGLMAGWICLLTAVLVAFVIPFSPT
jgi:heme/copper-type cytochrome/quinol oxidase subunit 4